MLKNKIDKKIKLNLKKKKHMNFRQQTNLAIQVMYSSVSIDFFYTIYYISFIKFIWKQNAWDFLVWNIFFKKNIMISVWD
jgi:hypothetical protein